MSNNCADIIDQNNISETIEIRVEQLNSWHIYLEYDGKRCGAVISMKIMKFWVLRFTRGTLQLQYGV